MECYDYEDSTNDVVELEDGFLTVENCNNCRHVQKLTNEFVVLSKTEAKC